MTLTIAPPNPVMAPTATEIVHDVLGCVARFYPDANPRPLVSFTPLVWGPMAHKLFEIGRGAKYGEPGYGLSFDEQLPSGSTINEASTAVETRLAQVELACGGLVDAAKTIPETS